MRNKIKRQVRFQGILKDSVALGVSREHLYRVLAGVRTSADLLARYQKLTGRKVTPLARFTVILMYPDYATDNYGETWCAPVYAADPVNAVQVAQKECAAAHGSIEDVDDLLPVSVFEGAHEDLVGKWAAAQCAREPKPVKAVPMTLTPGVRYELSELTVIDWTEGDGTKAAAPYDIKNYFTPDGRYRGPDIHGIEPICHKKA